MVDRRGLLVLSAALAWGAAGSGCAAVSAHDPAGRDEAPAHASSAPAPLSHSHHPAPNRGPLAAAVVENEPPREELGPQPVDELVRRALAENRMVQAAHFNVLALRARVPQVTSLDDPVVSNTIYPVPSIAPQYSLMGYNPYNLLLAQQFPWFGTLRLRGLAAEADVKVALFELAAAQLDVVSNVKRAYLDLRFNERSERILLENRKLAQDYLEIIRSRYETTSTGLQNVLQAEVAIRDVDRELVQTRQALAAARADLAQQLHISPESNLSTAPEAHSAALDAPEEVERLYHLAVAARPELQGRLAAIVRDERAIDLALKRYRPNMSVGLSYMDMSRGNAISPTAAGMPNVGLFVGFNLPVYRKKLAAGVAEAEARAAADARLYEAERDSAYREVKDDFTQAQSQRAILQYFQTSIEPKAREALETAFSGYANQTVDFPTLLTAWREVLQIQLQIARVEAELGKALASLERAVGAQINAHPPDHPENANVEAVPGAGAARPDRAHQGAITAMPPPLSEKSKGGLNGYPNPGPPDDRRAPRPDMPEALPSPSPGPGPMPMPMPPP